MLPADIPALNSLASTSSWTRSWSRGCWRWTSLPVCTAPAPWTWMWKVPWLLSSSTWPGLEYNDPCLAVWYLIMCLIIDITFPTDWSWRSRRKWQPRWATATSPSSVLTGGSTLKKSPRLRRINRKCSCRNPTAQTPPFLPRVKFAGGWDGLLTDWLLRYPGQSHSGRREATRGERGRAGHQSEIHQDISNSAHSQVLQVSQNLKIPLSKMWRHLKRIHQIDLLVRFISLLLINTRNNLIEIGFFFLLQKIYIS